MNKRSVHSSGFTLMEMLLALGIVAMLMLSLYATLQAAFRARDGANALVVLPRTAGVTMQLLRQDLENVLPPVGTLAGAFLAQPTGTGSMSDTLEFYCMGQGQADGDVDPTLAGGIHRVNLGLETIGQEPLPCLVRRTVCNLLAQQEIQAEPEILCRNVKQMALRYYDGSNWVDNWDSTTTNNTLPAAVQISLEIQEDASGKNAKSAVYRTAQIIPISCHHDSATTTGGGT